MVLKEYAGYVLAKDDGVMSLYKKCSEAEATSPYNSKYNGVIIVSEIVSVKEADLIVSSIAQQ